MPPNYFEISWKNENKRTVSQNKYDSSYYPIAWFNTICIRRLAGFQGFCLSYN
jgi:hypothetical protein